MNGQWCAASLLALAIVSTGVRADCLDDAAGYHHVHPLLLRAIAKQESGLRADRISAPNSNGTYDIGLMQINSAWLPTLANSGITKDSLMNACINAYVGAWILSQNMQRLGNTWNAVGAYNANAPEKRLAYANKIYRQLTRFSAQQSSSSPLPSGLSPVAPKQEVSRRQSNPRTAAAFSSTTTVSSQPERPSLTAYEVPDGTE